MDPEVAGLAGLLVEELARWWPAVGTAAGGMAIDTVTQLRAKATDAAGDAATYWVRQVVTKLFARHRDGSSVDPDGPIPRDAVLRAEVQEALDDLATDPSSRSVRRLLVHYVHDATVADPSLLDELRALLDQAPTMTGGSAGATGSINQANSGGVNVAVTGVATDIDARVGRL